MANFDTNEIFTATDVVRNFSAVLNKISNNQIKRAVILKNNKFQAVLLNMSEYERLYKAVEVLSSIYNSKKDNNG